MFSLVLALFASREVRAACLDAPGISVLGKAVFEASSALSAGDLEGFAIGRDRARLLLPCVRATDPGQSILPSVAGLARLMGTSAYLDGKQQQASAWFATSRSLWPSGNFTPSDPNLRELWASVPQAPIERLTPISALSKLRVSADNRWNSTRPDSRPAFIQVFDAEGESLLWAGLVPSTEEVPFGDIADSGPASQVPFEQGGEARLEFELHLLRGAIDAARRSLNALQSIQGAGETELRTWSQRAEDRVEAEEAAQRGDLDLARGLAAKVQITGSDPRERAWARRMTARLAAREGEPLGEFARVESALNEYKSPPFLAPEDLRWVEATLARVEAQRAESVCDYPGALEALRLYAASSHGGGVASLWSELQTLRIESLQAMGDAQDDRSSLSKLLRQAQAGGFQSEVDWAELAETALRADSGDETLDSEALCAAATWKAAQPACSPAAGLIVSCGQSVWRGYLGVGLLSGGAGVQQTAYEGSNIIEPASLRASWGLSTEAMAPLGSSYVAHLTGRLARASTTSRPRDSRPDLEAFIGLGPQGQNTALVVGAGVHTWRYWQDEDDDEGSGGTLTSLAVYEYVPELGLWVRPGAGRTQLAFRGGANPGFVPLSTELTHIFGDRPLAPRLALEGRYVWSSSDGLFPDGFRVSAWSLGASFGATWRWR